MKNFPFLRLIMKISLYCIATKQQDGEYRVMVLLLSLKIVKILLTLSPYENLYRIIRELR